MPLPVTLAAHDWVELENPLAVSSFAAAVPVGDRGAVRLATLDGIPRKGTTPPDAVDLAATVVEPVGEAIALGADLLIGYAPGDPASLGGTAVVIALFAPNNEAVFLTPCSNRVWTNPLNTVARSSASPSVVEFVRRVVDPASPEAAYLSEKIPPITDSPITPWEETDPTIRILDPVETPAEVLAKLTQVPVLLRVPATWADLNAVICLRIELGWYSECVPTRFEKGEVTVILWPYIDPLSSYPLEAWMLDSSGDLGGPIIKLATITPASLESASTGDTAVDLSLLGDPASIKGLTEQISTGVEVAKIEVISLDEAYAILEEATPAAVPVPAGEP